MSKDLVRRCQQSWELSSTYSCGWLDKKIKTTEKKNYGPRK